MIVKHGTIIDASANIDKYTLSLNGKTKNFFVESGLNFESVKQMAVDYIAGLQIEMGNASFKCMGYHGAWDIECEAKRISGKVQWDAFPNETYNDKTVEQRKQIEEMYLSGQK